MQLMIDTATESIAGLRLAGQFLFDHAQLREAMERGESSPPQTDIPPPPPPNVPTGTIFEGAANIPPPPLPDNVVPFIPPAPVAASPAQVIPNAPTVPPAPNALTETSVAVVDGLASSAALAPTTTPNNASPVTTTSAAIELDSSHMPWDERIHLKNKTKKNDGTWKLRRGLDAAVVESVTKELHARMINSPPVEVAAPSFPGGNGSVPVPPPPALAGGSGQSPVLPSQPGSAGGVPIPPPPTNGSVPVPPPPVTLQPAAVPVPPAPVLGVPNVDGAPPMQFRELVQKITELRKSNRLTGEQVTSLVQQVGAPSLQMLNNMPHLIPQMNDLVDAVLLMS